MKYFIGIYFEDWKSFMKDMFYRGVPKEQTRWIRHQDQLRGLRMNEEDVFYGRDWDRVAPKEVINLYIVKK